MNLQEAVVVNFAFGIGLVLLFRLSPVRWTGARAAAVLLLLCLTLRYAWWRVSMVPSFDWTFGSLWPLGFLALEGIALLHEMWASTVMIRKSNHTPKSDRYERMLRMRADLPTVDVFIATYSEGTDILEQTIRAALNLDYPKHLLTVYVGDDGNRPDVKKLAERLNVRYFARPTTKTEDCMKDKEGGHGKGGNDRYLFRHSGSEYIVMLDADFQLHPSFIFRTLGFLIYDTDIGLVQTPQRFRNHDPIGRNLGAPEFVPEEQHFFMTITQPCRDAWGNAFCVGTGCIVSRKALTRVDPLWGFPKETICEDMELSYVLRLAGYRTLLLNEPLAYGLAPEDAREFLKQRIRWCAGTVQHLFIRTGPIRGRHRLLDRLFYLDGFLYWLGFPFLSLLVLAPAVFWCTGVPAIGGRPEDALLVLLPRLVARAVIVFWLSEGKLPPIAVNVSKILPAFDLSATILKSLVRPWSATFKVTTKGLSQDAVVIHWRRFLGFLAIAGVTMGAMLMNLTGRWEAVITSDITPLNVTWSMFSALVCTLCALACVEPPKGRDYLEEGTRNEVVVSKPAKLMVCLLRRLVGFA